MANGWSAEPNEVQKHVKDRQKKPKQWTVMVYLAGDNNLSEEMIYAIKEMYRVGVTKDVDVIVQFDPSAIGAPVRRYVISKEELEKDAMMSQIQVAIAAISPQKAKVASASQALITSAQDRKQAHSPYREDDSPSQAPTFVQLRKEACAASHSPYRTGESQSQAQTFAELRKEHCTASHSPQERKTDVVAGLDIDSNIIETLGIPLDGKSTSPKAEKIASARRFSLKGAASGTPSKGLPKRLNVENSADPEVLEQFITESIDFFPSKYYMVVLSGHGSGALGDFLPDFNASTGTGQLQSLSIPSLNRVLENVGKKLSSQEIGGKKINIVGMDSCLMSMAEMGHELEGKVDFLVGSESFVLNTGWPYHRVLEALNLNSTIEPDELAKEIVKKYISYYVDYEIAGASTDQSACDLAQLDQTLVPQLRNLVGALTKGLDHPVFKDEIVLAHWEAQSYKGEQYTDVYDFCDRLQLRCLRQPTAIKGLQDYPQPDSQKELDHFGKLLAEAKTQLSEAQKQQLLVANRNLSAAQEQLSVANGKLSAAKEQLSVANVKLSAAKAQLSAANGKLSKTTEKALAESGIVKEADVTAQKRTAETAQKVLDDAQKAVDTAQTEVETAQTEAVSAAQQTAIQAAVLSKNVDKLFEALLNGKNVAPVSKKVDGFLAALAEKNDTFTVQVIELMMRCWVAKAAVKKVTLVSCYSGPAFQHSNGLSVFFPWFEEEDVLDAYGNLRFAAVTHWAKFLRKYLETTRTERRNQKDHPEQPLRIGPAANSLETIVASSVPPLRSCINPKGLSSGSGSMKNPPDGFYRDKCGS